MKMLVNLLCQDIDAQMAFYQALFGFAEIESSRSPIYRVVDTGASELGFNAPPARGLLGLPAPAGPGGVTSFATCMADEPARVDQAAERTAILGGRVIKPPFLTYYGQWQTVLADPEGHAFRVSCLKVPA